MKTAFDRYFHFALKLHSFDIKRAMLITLFDLSCIGANNKLHENKFVVLHLSRLALNNVGAFSSYCFTLDNFKILEENTRSFIILVEIDLCKAILPNLGVVGENCG